MGNQVQIFRPVDITNFALYVEGAICAFNQFVLSWGEDEIPMVTGVVAPTEVVVGNEIFSWRSIPPMTKIEILFRDDNWGEIPRYTVWFEGELVSPGFSRTDDSKNFQFQARHITGNLEGLALTALEPGAYLEEMIQGISQETPLETAIAGTIIEKFSPEAIREALGLPEEKLDVYAFVRGALRIFLARVAQSTVSEAYPVQAVMAYGMLERLYQPETSEQKRLKWQKLYTLIMNYTFIEMLPKLTGRMTFLEMVRVILKLFLHEIQIMPNPRTFANTLQVKPHNVFITPPECNVIYPIFSVTYEYIEPWENKPTRLIQITNPAGGIPDPLMRQYFRNIAPSQLADKFKAYTEAKTDEEKRKISLVTEEEKIRGIVESYNDIPAFLSAAFQAVTQEDPFVPGGSAGSRKIDGVATPVSGGVETTTSIGYSEGMQITAKVKKAVFAKKFMHEQLLIVEGYANPGDKISRTLLLESKPAIKSRFKYRPARIYVVPPAFKASANYYVEGGKVTRRLGRYFHIFEEPSGCIPLMLRVDLPKSEVDALKMEGNNKSPSIKVIGNDEATSVPTTALKDSAARPLIQNVKPSLSGGTHYSVVIALNEQSHDDTALAGKLAGVICELCELDPNKDIITLTDELGDKASGRENKDPAMKAEIIKQALETVTDIRSKMEAAYNGTKTSEDKADDLSKVTEKATGIQTPKPLPVTQEIAPDFVFHPTVVQISGASADIGDEDAKAAIRPENIEDTLRSTVGDLRFAEIQRALVAASSNVSIPQAELYPPLAAFYLNRYRARKQLSAAFLKTFAVDPNAKPLELAKIKAMGDCIRALDKAFTEQDKTQLQLKAYRQNPSKKLLHMLFSLQIALDSGYTAGRDAWASAIKASRDKKLSEFISLRDAGHFPSSTVSDFERYLQMYREYLGGNASGDSQWMGMAQLVIPADRDIQAVTNNPAELEQKTEVDEKAVSADEQLEIKLQTLKDNYTQPVCDYYFYHNRHVNNVQRLNMTFHPYLVPSYSGVLVDSSILRMHLRCHIVHIDQVVMAEAVMTNATVRFVRRADEDRKIEIAQTARPKIGKVEEPDAVYHISIPEMIGEKVPFFGGEYSTSVNPETGRYPLDDTYRKTLGCGMWNNELDPKMVNISDWKEAAIGVRREMQCCQIVGAPADLQAAFDAYYLKNPSKIVFEWKGGKFPDKIEMAAGAMTPEDILSGKVPVKLKDERPSSLRKVPFREDIQQFVLMHTNMHRTRRAMPG